MAEGKDVRGTIVRCIRPTPGLFFDARYEIMAVERHIIMGPLVRIRPLGVKTYLPDAYYPWRFERDNSQ